MAPPTITPIADRRITKQTEQILATLMTDPTADWSGSEIAPASGLKSGTLYPALLRMHRFGWLSWQWEDVDPSKEKRPRKRLYRLTGTGEMVAREIAARAAIHPTPSAPVPAIRPFPKGLTA